MPVEFIGMIQAHERSELLHPRSQIYDAAIDPPYIARFAQALKDGGFDRGIIPLVKSKAARRDQSHSRSTT